MVGPTTRSKKGTGPPTGASVPTTESASQSSGAGRALLPASCPLCQRSFTTVNGLGQHRRRAHPEVVNAEIQTDRKKARWSKEELMRLAHAEARLVIEGCRFLNQELLKSFPDRTLDSIKGQRKGKAYRESVASFVSQLRSSVASAGPSGASPVAEEPLPGSPSVSQDDEVDAAIWSALADLPSSGSRFKLVDDIVALGPNTSRDIVRSMLPSALDAVGSKEPAAHPPLPFGARRPPDKKRARRRWEYAAVQRAFRKNAARCVNGLLDGTLLHQPPSIPGLVEFWKDLFTAPCASSRPRSKEGLSPMLLASSQPVSFRDLWAPITSEEAAAALPPRNSAAGPDALTPAQLRRLPHPVFLKILNLFLLARSLPSRLLRARTTLLPKKTSPASPADFRPITVCSVLARAFHKVLAGRLMRYCVLDGRQRAFIPQDGMLHNSFLLDLAMAHSRRTACSLYVASLDVSKAFDSLDHGALSPVLRAHGLPVEFVEYVRGCYQASTTVICGGGSSSDLVRPSKGVRQGDPLSPILFNLSIDLLLSRLPGYIGARIFSRRVNAAAFADDILLFAETKGGLQELLSTATSALGDLGLEVNPFKCFSLALVASGREKKVKVDNSVIFRAGNKNIPALAMGDTFRYLGLQFSTSGLSQFHPRQEVQEQLDIIKRAPLKPQQRLFALRSVILPGTYHGLALGRTRLGALKSLDVCVRAAVRAWLRLPDDTPIGYFHAPVIYGGLGIPATRWLGPLLRRRRLASMEGLGVIVDEPSQDILKREICRLDNYLKWDGDVIKTSYQLGRFWALRLHSSVDGAALRRSAQTPGQHSWVSNTRLMLSGRDFLACVRARISALPSRARLLRGREGDTRCRAGCNASETNNHVIQHCWRSHEARVERHDAVALYMVRGLRRRGYDVHRELHLRTSQGLKKPDIVAVSGTTAFVIDAQVIGDHLDADRCHREKVEVYDQQPVHTEIKRMFPEVQMITTTSATLNWRGVWSPASAKALIGIGFNSNHLSTMATRALLGSIMAARRFDSMTAPRRRMMPRTGVG
uniref:R2 protein n=1 Tax=Eyprepocnemis plorans TaxID=34655 RepID=A0A0R4WRV8_9ORTH|nr:R2 protein [Eyprepocnemis plorans]